MFKSIPVVFLIACLLLSSCQAVIPEPLIEVLDEDTEGASVSFRVAIDKPGWLVLHPAATGGGPDAGSEITRAYLAEAGEYAKITMPVTDAIIGNVDGFAMLHYDEPADEAYTFAPGGDDDPPVTVDDAVLMAPFTMHGATPYIEVQDSGAGDGVITIKVGIDKPGWLVLRTATAEGRPDVTVLTASTYLSAAGVYPGFEVTLPTTPARPYFAILYYDDPADGEFTHTSIGTDDPAVQVQGAGIEEAFTIGY
ncbi:MAG TPA: hypothetical protein G4O07_01750 [Dehalococcoidia bacterium]|nr:hypothetical protein [Dehalococcoidia bacterium]